MEELILNAFILDKQNYLSYSSSIDRVDWRANSPKHYTILQSIDKLYQTEDKISLNDVEINIYTNGPGMAPKERELYKAIFSNMRGGGEINVGRLQELLESTKIRHEMLAGMQLCNDVYRGAKPLSEFLEFSDRVRGGIVIATPEEVADFMDMELDDLDAAYHGDGLQWKQKTLRAMLGRLRKGDFGVIFARPEVGKTTLISDNGVYFASQMDRPYIHFNNEEAGIKIKNRYYQSALGVTTKELLADKAANRARFQEITRGNVRLVDRAILTRKEVERICQKHNPGFILLDSIDKLWGFGESNTRDDLHYKLIYQWARELAKEYGPVIGSCHASADGANRQWLTMENVAYAKTAKQGECDWILGIGTSDKQGNDSMRYLHTCKNKQLADQELVEKYRHGKLPIKILADIGQYMDILGDRELSDGD